MNRFSFHSCRSIKIFPFQTERRLPRFSTLCLVTGFFCSGCHVIAVKEHRSLKDPLHSSGEELVRQHCVKCHSITPTSPVPRLTGAVALPLEDIERMKHYPREYLVRIISEGGESVGRSRGMPRWDEVFSREEILRIVDYLQGGEAIEKSPPPDA